MQSNVLFRASSCFFFVIAFCGSSIAQEVKSEVWPELNAYYKRHKVTFMRLAAGLHKSDEILEHMTVFSSLICSLVLSHGLERKFSVILI
jgi:hypothetical protein